MGRRAIQAIALVAVLVLVLVTALILRPPAPEPSRPPLPAVEGRQVEVVPGQYVVKFRTGVSHAERDAIHRAVRSQLVRRVDIIAVDVVSPSEAISALAGYGNSPHVLYVEPNYVVRAAVVPNDPLYADEWAMPTIRAPQAWDVTTGSQNVVVAVVDTGVDPLHPDLAANVGPGWNILADNDQASDDNGHGTHVASLAAAVGGDGVGIAGVAWRATILPVKMLDGSGAGDEVSAAAGVRWAVDHGANVINMSWGTLGNSRVISDEIGYARSRRVVLVAAAGNFATSLPFYPAAFDGVVGVAATDRADQPATFSNCGSYVDLAAPGVAILGAYRNGTYATLSGTSMAAPLVTGSAALILALRPDLSSDRVERLLRDSAVDLGAAGRDDRFGSGRLDTFGAVQRAPDATPVVARSRLALPLVVSLPASPATGCP